MELQKNNQINSNDNKSQKQIKQLIEELKQQCVYTQDQFNKIQESDQSLEQSQNYTQKQSKKDDQSQQESSQSQYSYSNKQLAQQDFDQEIINIQTIRKKNKNQPSSPLFIPFIKSQQQILEIQQKQNRRIKSFIPVHEKQAFPWLTKITKSISTTQLRFHNQIFEFYQYIKPSKIQKRLKLLVIQQLKIIIKQTLGDVQIKPFGSYATQLYLPDGDMDIVVLTINANENKNIPTRVQNIQLCHKVYKYLKKNYKSVYSFIKLIDKAKIPLIKICHRQSEILIDLSFNSYSGLQQVRHINLIKQIYPQFQILVFVFKCFLEIRKYNETFKGGIGSYLLNCMIYQFLRICHDSYKSYLTLGQLVLKFMRYCYINLIDQFNKTSIYIRTGEKKARARRANTISIICPIDNKTDIGRKAFRISQIFAIFRNRYQNIIERHFQPGQSILKVLVNNQTNIFHYYESKSQSKMEELKQIIKKLQKKLQLIDKEQIEIKFQNQLYQQIKKQNQKKLNQKYFQDNQFSITTYIQNSQKQKQQEKLIMNGEEIYINQQDQYRKFMTLNGSQFNEKIQNNQNKFKLQLYKKRNVKIKSYNRRNKIITDEQFNKLQVFENSSNSWSY